MCIWSDTRQVFKKDVKITSFFKRSWGNCEEQLLDDNIVTKRLETVDHLLTDCNGQQMSLKLLAESQSSVGQQLPNSPPTDSPQVCSKELFYKLPVCVIQDSLEPYFQKRPLHWCLIFVLIVTIEWIDNHLLPLPLRPNKKTKHHAHQMLGTTYVIM